MDVKKKTPPKSHIHTLTKSLISRLPSSLVSYPSSFLLSFLLSRAILLGVSAPFGLSVGAALGVGKLSLISLIGATLGYISVFEKINSLKYIAILVLVFTAHFVFSETSLVKKKYFTPLAVALPSLCINFVFLASDVFSIFDTSVALFEILLSAICSKLFLPLRDIEKTSFSLSPSALLALAAGLFSSLSSPLIFGIISPGRILALLLTLLISACGGLGSGAVSGLVFGAALSFSLSSAEYAIILGLCGILNSFSFSFGKPLTLLFSFLFSGCICACINPQLAISFLIEFPVSAVLFLLSENSFEKLTRRFFTKAHSHSDTHLRRYATERLNFAAKAFKTLSSTLSEIHRKEDSKNLSDIRTVFEKTSRSFCKKCSLRTICWDRDFQSTKDAFIKAGEAITKNGALTARDFPIYFSSRCLNTENFVNYANREIFSMRFGNQLFEEREKNRELLTKQYSDISSIFSLISLDIADNTRFDENAEAEIHNILTRHGILCNSSAYRDSENRINIHLCGRDLTSVVKNRAELIPLFENACNTRLSEPQLTSSKELDDVIIRELPKFRASFGAAVKSRSNLSQSGDSGTLIYPSHGHLALLLSDGMGSGKLAAKESAKSITLLSELLRGGLSPKDALASLQTALMLRAESTGTFATLDLFCLNLFNGQGEIHKLGGAPTYIKKGKNIRRITASTLPAGVSLNGKYEPDFTPLTLEKGDFVIMTSDGIADGGDDVKFLEFLSENKASSPKVLADDLLAFSLSCYDKNDDMTVAVILIDEE